MIIQNPILKFLARLLILAPLLKSSLEIVIINEGTPSLIVERFQSWLRLTQNYVYVDQDILIRFILQNQAYISLIYGSLIFYLSFMTVFNSKSHILPLVSLILFSIFYFYLELQQPLSFDKIQELFTMVSIIACLFLIKGENIFSPLVNVPVPPLQHDLQESQPPNKQQQNKRIQKDNKQVQQQQVAGKQKSRDKRK